MIGPLPVAPVIARLKAQAPLLKTVSHAADLRTALDQQPAAVPAAYVVRMERARPAAGASGGVLIQEIDVDVVVVLFVRNYTNTADGSAAAAEMDQVIAQTRAGLLNWSPVAGACDPLRQNASRDESYRAGVLVTQELYRTRYRLEIRP